MAEQVGIDGDQVIASAVQYLIEGNEMDAAQVLLFCNIENMEFFAEEDWGRVNYRVEISLRGPRMAVDRLDDPYDGVDQRIRTAITHALPFEHWLSALNARASIHVPDDDWRADLLEITKGKGVSNQASGAENPRFWQGFRFRSATEIKIAEALDRAGVLFFPLPKARVVTDKGHMNVEPDFVICQEGRWGILEVDGEPFHPPTRSAIEHDRDRLFRRHGVVCVERFDAKRCYENPDKTVEEFLLLMVKAHRRP